MQPEALLTVDDVHTYYGESYVLQGVSLKLPPNRVVALLGRNGMGKTTLIRSIAGLTPPERGSIRLRGGSLTDLQPYQIAQLGVGLVPQGRRLFGSLSVKENLSIGTSKLAGYGTRRGNQSNRWTLDDVLTQFPALKERWNNRARSLSGGEQQMLAIGRALMTNPDVLLMDEPSEGLAPVIVQEVQRILLKLKERGLSILLVEQALDVAMAVADIVYILTNGQIVYQGTPDDLRQRDDIRLQHLGV